MSALTTVSPSVVNQLVLAPATTSPGQFQSFTVIDASHDDSPTTVFSGGVLRVNYSINPPPSATAMVATGTGTGNPTPTTTSALDHVTIEAWQPDLSTANKTAYAYPASGALAMIKVADLQTFTATSVSDGLVNLLNTNKLAGGTMTIQATAYFKDGTKVVASGVTMQVKTGPTVTGTFQAETFDISQVTGNGLVINGNGGTDLLNLSLIDSSQIASIDGMSPTNFSPTAGGQAIYQGVAVDYVRLTNGREIYFTGIEKIQVMANSPSQPAFVAGASPIQVQTIGLAVRPDDSQFGKQWNLQITDVPDAWRFTTGSKQVLLVSLDGGVLPTAKGGGAIHGTDQGRLITDSSDDDNFDGIDYGHGLSSISLMIATANDGFLPFDDSGISGINWVSSVYVNDVYHGVDLQKAIRDAFAFADARGLDVVFQGGIQGEPWLTSGGSQDELERLISSHANSLFVIAAGNGGEILPDGSRRFPDYMTTVSGAAKLETTHANVMSVGALTNLFDKVTVDGLDNSKSVQMDSGSSRGSNLTMVAPTDSQANEFADNFTHTFTGTSCANPQLAAIASLVWSINPQLSGAQVRFILQQTAMDLGAAGRDNTFGSGLVDAGLAVRRAVALTRDYDLAMLPQFTLANPAPTAATTAAPITVAAAAATAAKLPASSTTSSTANAMTPPSISPPASADPNFSGRNALIDAVPTSAERKTVPQDTAKVQVARTSLFAELAQTISHGNVPTKQVQGLLGVSWI